MKKLTWMYQYLKSMLAISIPHLRLVSLTTSFFLLHTALEALTHDVTFFLPLVISMTPYNFLYQCCKDNAFMKKKKFQLYPHV